MSHYVLEDVLGARGQTNLRFLHPTAVTAVAGGAEVAIADYNHRIQIITPLGHFRRIIGSPHGHDGLRYPSGIVADADGYSVIIADMRNHRLVRLRTADGKVLSNASSWQPSFGQHAQPLKNPRCVAMHMTRWGGYGMIPLLFVASDAGVSTFALAPTQGGSISLPGLVPLGKDAAMVPMIAFRSTNGMAPPMASSGIAAADMLDGTHIYVADTNYDRVQDWHFHSGTTTFRHVRNIGEGGELPGQFRRPVGLAVLPHPSGELALSRLFVAERDGKRIQVLDTAGKPLQVLASDRAARFGGMCFARRSPTDASADAQRLVVMSRSSHQVFIFRRQRRPAAG